MKKWFVLAAGLALQAVLGGIYAWSEFAVSLVADFGLSQAQCGAIFGVTIAAFAASTIPAGRMLQRRGPRSTAVLGVLLFAAGYLSASFSQGNFGLLLASFGLLVGVGTGFAYVCPLTIGMKWFPDNRGLVTGVAVAGFGGGAILLSSVSEYLLLYAGYDVMSLFRFIALVFGGVALVSATAMVEPPCDHQCCDRQSTNSLLPDIMTKSFALIFLGMFTGTFAGLLVIGNLKAMMLKIGFGELDATLAISLFAAGNIFGRIMWGQLHDRLGSRITIIAANLLLAFSMAMLLLEMPGRMPLLLTPVVGAAFGGCFVIYAATVVERFGTTKFAGLYPVSFLAYGFAALIGPAMGGYVADRTGSFAHGILIAVVVVVVNTVVFAVNFSAKAEEQLECNEMVSSLEVCPGKKKPRFA
jgi:OFA family oxalate/formate antiporter-like MFS transporter